jgi:hypothetical protein
MSNIGSALNAWSLVETGMGLVFYSVSGISSPPKAGAIYDAIVAFEGRLAMIDAAIQSDDHLITSDEKEWWPCFSAKLRKLYKKRHQVAHFSVIPDQSWSAISPYFTWNKAAQNAAKWLTVPQIKELSDRFEEAGSAITWFNGVLQQRMLPPERRTPQPAEPPLIARMRDSAVQKKAAQKPPRPASAK